MDLIKKKEYLSYVIDCLISNDRIADAETMKLVLKDDNIIEKLDPHTLSKSSKFLSYVDWSVERRKRIIDNI